MKRSNRFTWWGGIALSAIIILTLIAAPNSSKINIGSTYNSAPDGYRAWYVFMQHQGISIQRWQKPFSDLKADKKPVTLLVTNTELRTRELLPQEQEWIEAGNTLVFLGVREPATAADFSTIQKSPLGKIKIDTRRRLKVADEKVFLGDRFGAVVWEESYGKGKVIFSTTPYLAANAYQDYLSNFQYLANLVNQKGNIIFVDEYIHGYKDASVINKEGKGSLLSYFQQTPLFPVLIQVVILLIVLIWGQNRRLGKPEILQTTEINNSQAYIEALAGVLQKADKSDFVIETVGKEQYKQLKKALGLGQNVDNQTLTNAWVQQTGSPAPELDALLEVQKQKRPMNEKDLKNWLNKWQNIWQRMQKK